MFFFFYLDALAACNYLPQSREKIIAALFKALNSTNNELQEAGEACMRKVSVTALFFFNCKHYLTFICKNVSKFTANYENPTQELGLVLLSYFFFLSVSAPASTVFYCILTLTTFTLIDYTIKSI